MDPAIIARWRMQNILLRGSPARTPCDVIGTLGASQGQDFLPALWSMSQRSPTSPPYDEVAAAFDRGELVRTHVLRPTWHLVAPADLRWLLTATAPRVHQANAYYYRQVGVDADTMRRVRSTLERELPGKHLTRAEIATELAADGVEASGLRLGYITMYAELEQWICSGARRGKQQTYALLEDRVPGRDDRSREEALAELGRRYFRTRAPATIRDLAGWASLTLAEARTARAALGSEFQDVEVDGRTYVVAGEAPTDDAPPQIELVQQYDECIMSYSESKDVLVGDRPMTYGPPTAMFHAILLDGQLLGRWRYDRTRTVETTTYRTLTDPEQEALTKAVTDFERF